jgi:hypothetical protein
MQLLKRKGQMKRERRREKTERKRRRKWFEKRTWENVPGSSSSSVVVSFYFPCELSRSRAYSSTTQMAFRQREFLFKKKIEKERKTGQK